MKLFDTIEAVKFPEENMIFITRGGYLYYIYNPNLNGGENTAMPETIILPSPTTPM